MVKEINIEGFDAFMAEVGKYSGSDVYALFSGSHDSAGNSWCPDCVVADPVVRECLKDLPDDAVFIHCGVGARDFWKDKSNIFRTHEKLKLTSVPTLLKWGTNQRLSEEQCAKKDLVQMLFED